MHPQESGSISRALPNAAAEGNPRGVAQVGRACSSNNDIQPDAAAASTALGIFFGFPKHWCVMMLMHGWLSAWLVLTTTADQGNKVPWCAHRVAECVGCKTCCTSAPVASQSADMELMEEMRCARNALAVSLDSSALHRLAHKMRSTGIQCSYTDLSTPIARCPLSVSFPPISTCVMGKHAPDQAALCGAVAICDPAPQHIEACHQLMLRPCWHISMHCAVPISNTRPPTQFGQGRPEGCRNVTSRADKAWGPGLHAEDNKIRGKELVSRTRSGLSRSAIAVPSARNSGLDRISKCTLGSAQFRRSTCGQDRVF